MRDLGRFVMNGLFRNLLHVEAFELLNGLGEAVRNVVVLTLFLFTLCLDATVAELRVDNIELVISDDPLSKCCDEICSTVVSPDGSIIACKAYHSDVIGNKGIVLWSSVNGSLIGLIDGPPGGVFSLRFSRDGRRIGSSDGQIWNVLSKRRLLELPTDDDGTYAIAFSPDGKTVASSGGRFARNINLWDSQTGSHIQVFKSDMPTGKELWFGGDGGTLLSVGRSFLQFWSVETGQLKRVMRPECGAFTLQAYSDVRQLLAVTDCASTGAHNIRLYQAETGRLIGKLIGQGAAVRSLEFSPDGRFVASSGDDLTISLWDINDGTVVRTFTGHSRIVRTLAFSPDGRTLVSGGGDNDTKIWSVPDGTLIATLRIFKDGNWISYTPDGYYQCSEAATKYIRWKAGNKFFDETVYRMQFLRPDVLVQRLQNK